MPPTSSPRPKLKFVLTDTEFQLAQNVAAFGGVLTQLLARRTTGLGDAVMALVEQQTTSSDPEAASGLRATVLSLCADTCRPLAMNEIFGRALAFVARMDPEELGRRFQDAEVQLTTVPHGTRIEERLVSADEGDPVILVDPRGRPIGSS